MCTQLSTCDSYAMHMYFQDNKLKCAETLYTRMEWPFPEKKTDGGEVTPESLWLPATAFAAPQSLLYLEVRF